MDEVVCVNRFMCYILTCASPEIIASFSISPLSFFYLICYNDDTNTNDSINIMILPQCICCRILNVIMTIHIMIIAIILIQFYTFCCH